MLMAGTRDPMFDANLTVGISDHLVELLRESILAAQQYGAATMRSPEKCPTLMVSQKRKVQELLAALQAELSKRYEAGLEIAGERS